MKKIGFEKEYFLTFDVYQTDFSSIWPAKISEAQ